MVERVFCSYLIDVRYLDMAHLQSSRSVEFSVVVFASDFRIDNKPTGVFSLSAVCRVIARSLSDVPIYLSLQTMNMFSSAVFLSVASKRMKDV